MVFEMTLVFCSQSNDVSTDWLFLGVDARPAGHGKGRMELL